MENDRVVLGLSGGVDSALAARLLTEAGYQVNCLYLDNGVGDAGPARQAAAELGLPFFLRDIRPALEARVCAPFVRDYRAGRTPSPCPLCNAQVKLPALLALADALDCGWVATGHYARVARGPGGQVRLLRGRGDKDQSYMLARLAPGQLRRCLFPLGEYDKPEVRALARSCGLSAADRPDSMELCFVPDGDYAAWLERRGPVPPPGDFVDREGRVLGRHRGIHRYTLGQGSGLGLSGPHKYYVSAIRPAENQVVLSDGSDLLTRRVLCEALNWLSPQPLAAPRSAAVRFRHGRSETPALLLPQPDGRLLVRTDAPVRAPAPGQLAVFYDGETVLGSGWIAGEKTP